jgi:hypothetical protein
VRLIIFLASLVSAIGAQGATIPIYVQSTSSDQIGQQVVYYLKQDIASSSQFRLVYAQPQASFTINIVTMSTGPSNNMEYSAAYSATLIEGADAYVTNYVGVCGSARIASCASNIISGFGGVIDQLR